MTENLLLGSSCGVEGGVGIGDVQVQPIRDYRELRVFPSGSAPHALTEGHTIQPQDGDQISLCGHTRDAGTRCDAVTEPFGELILVDGVRKGQARPPAPRRGLTCRALRNEGVDRRRGVKRGAPLVTDRTRESLVLGAKFVDGPDGHGKPRRYLCTVEKLLVAHVHEYNVRGDKEQRYAPGRHAAVLIRMRTRFRNLVPMTRSNVDEIRQELQAVAVELAKKEELIDRRDELIEKARSQTPPLTLREVAQLLGMTERGVAKALSSHRDRNHRLAS